LVTIAVKSARRGFALLVVMTILAGSAAVGLQASLSGNGAFQAARNRVALARAYWRAQGCLERLRADIGQALRADSVGNNAWSRIDSIPVTASWSMDCRVAAQPSGMTIDIDSVTDDQLRAVLAAGNHSAAEIDSTVDAFRDWTDPDTITRPRGAERSWYYSAHRPGPRNGPLTSIQELHLIRGFEAERGMDSLFGLESGRLSLDRAPLPLLGLLPGITSEVLAAFASLRAVGQPVGDLAVLANRLSPEARESFLRHYAEILARTSPIPQWWTVRLENTQGSPPVRANVEVRLVRSGNDAAIVRYRTWP
jgi:type II secretory pathway component PulK